MKKTRLDEVAWTRVSHNPKILKKVMLAANEAPGLTNFSQAVFSPGQVAPGHIHDDMYEVFFVQSGSASIVIGETEHALEQGSCVLIEPGDWHEVRNASEENLTLLYFGLTAQDVGNGGD